MPDSTLPLSQAQLDAFVTDGFVRIDNAFPRELADAARAILWRDTGCDPDDPATWTRPVIRLGQYGQPPFAAAANTPKLHAAFDQLVGQGRWLPRHALGTFPVRFPHPDDPGDAGWHVDASFRLPTDDPNDIFAARSNLRSRDRALLMLFNFSDVGEDDAPTRIRVGSHLEVARYLQPAGENGKSLNDMIRETPDWFPTEQEALAIGDAGTVYLCHPFLVHAAQPHRGTRVKFMAQPPLAPALPFDLDRPDGDFAPVEQAILLALA